MHLKGCKAFYLERSSCMDDGKLLTLLNQRNELALEAVSYEYGGLCRSILSNILKDTRDIEECLNSVYMRVWSSIPPAQPRDLKAYIAKTARNEALMRLRSNSRSPIEEELKEELISFMPRADSYRHAESELAANELAEAISRFLHGQSPQKRAVFMRRYWYFDSINDIAAKYGMSRSKVTSMLFRLRNELKTALEREELL